MVTTPPRRNTSDITGIVMTWLYFKARQRHIGFHMPDNVFGPLDTPERVLQQIAADVGHSFLLQRMLMGYAPLPEEEYQAWKARNFEGWFDYLKAREEKTP
jgi:hypothetical protein